MNAVNDLMGLWFVLALIAPCAWALVNILDKVVITHLIPSPLVRIVIDGVIEFSIAALLLIVVNVVLLPPFLLILSILTGVLLFVFNYLYYLALKNGAVSGVSAILQLVPVFSIMWGALFFRETFTLLSYVGMALIVIGPILVSVDIQNGVRGLIDTRSIQLFVYLIPAVFILSIGYALQKYILQWTNPETVFFWGRVGGLIFSGSIIALSPTSRRTTTTFLQKARPGSIGALIIISTLNLIGIYSLAAAYKTGPVSLITVLASTQPAIAYLVLIFHQYSRLKLLPPDIKEETSLVKIVGLLTILAGVLLISI